MQGDLGLHGHAALVTGAGRRLGRAFAEALASRGASVALHYGGSTEAVETAVRLAREAGVRTIALQADLGAPDQAAALLERAQAEIGDVDLLVNSAAIFEPVEVAGTSLESWQRHMAVNLTAPFLLCQSFARLRRGRPGAIVNILDWRALRPGPDHFPYTVSKAGLAAMTESLAQGLAPYIRVNGLALGAILPAEGSVPGANSPIAGVPAGRWGTPAEASDALLFLLAGPDFITGHILYLDGGRHLA